VGVVSLALRKNKNQIQDNEKFEEGHGQRFVRERRALVHENVRWQL
jgi:hypothetical protein